MELIRGLHNLAARHRGSAVSIGNFDGLHRGHQALIARLQVLAAEHRVPATIVIFEPTPREFFAPDSAPRRVSGFRGKLRLLQRAGVARVLCLRFNRALAELAAEDFVDQVLVRGLGARAVIVGDDFRYGRRRAGDLALLQRVGANAGFSAEGLGSVRFEGERCSSTALRAALSKPDLSAAADMLGRRYRMIGRVRHGLKLGRRLGMPTLNLHLHHPPALAEGVYAVRAFWPACTRGADGVASLGMRPTLASSACLLETHLFDFDATLYGAEIEVEFRHYLRPQQRFDTLDALAVQMQHDGREARSLLENDARPGPVMT